MIIKNATKFSANIFCFYAFTGYDVVNMNQNSKQGSAMDFFHEIRCRNPFNHIIVILGNFSAHKTEDVAITAEFLDIEPIFLPPYSTQLNSIEENGKSIKRIISRTLVKDQALMVETVKTNFIDLPKKKTFCENWMGVLAHQLVQLVVSSNIITDISLDGFISYQNNLPQGIYTHICCFTTYCGSVAIIKVISANASQ